MYQYHKSLILFLISIETTEKIQSPVTIGTFLNLLFKKYKYSCLGLLSKVFGFVFSAYLKKKNFFSFLLSPMYWVGQKDHPGFPITSYLNELFDQPNRWLLFQARLNHPVPVAGPEGEQGQRKHILQWWLDRTGKLHKSSSHNRHTLTWVYLEEERSIPPDKASWEMNYPVG